MIIPKVNIKNILSSESSEKTKESVNVKEQEKTSASPKEYNKEECLNNLWIELISCLFDEEPKTTLKELMSKKYSNNSYLERKSSDNLKKKNNDLDNTEVNVSSPVITQNNSKRNLFKIGGHSRSSSLNSVKKGSNKKEEKDKTITNEPENFTSEDEAIFNTSEEIDSNSAINLDSKEFKQKIWECLFWTAGIEGLDTLLLRFIVAR